MDPIQPPVRPTRSTFARAFAPGLVTGVISGLFLGVFISPFLGRIHVTPRRPAATVASSAASRETSEQRRPSTDVPPAHR